MHPVHPRSSLFLPLRVWRYTQCSLLLLLLAGCAGPAPEKTARVLWPLPPHAPQLEFVGVVANNLSFQQQTPWSKFRRLLLDRKVEPFFERPFAVAADRRGRVFVTDSLQRNVRILDLDRKSLDGFAPDFTFRRPMGVAVDGEDRVYVADGGLRTICVFTPDGTLLRTIGDAGALINPSFIALDEPRGRIYVADAAMHKVKAFSLTGEFLFEIGGKGNGQGEFFMPQGMAVAGDGQLYVTDTLNSRIQIFDSEGRYLRNFGSAGSGYWNLEHPRDVTLAGNGDVYLVDYRKAQLNGYQADGEFLVAVGVDKSSGHLLAFAAPTSVAIDRQQRIYVSDTMNKRITVWQILKLVPRGMISSPNLRPTRCLTLEIAPSICAMIIRSVSSLTPLAMQA